VKSLLIGIALACAAAGVLYAATLGQGRVECEACMEYGGHATCSRVAAATRQEAEHRSITHACSVLASGVTRSLECQRVPPRSLVCDE
jgi:hypothetical protein